MRRLTMTLIAGLAVAFFGAPAISQAQLSDDDYAKAVRSCDKNLQKEAQKFKADFEKRLGKCTDQALLERFKDEKNIAGGAPEKTDFAKRADKCEGQLEKALGAGGKLEKMLAKISDAYSGDCGEENADGTPAFVTIGYLDNSVAPGGATSWAQGWIASQMMFGALEYLFTVSADSWETFDVMVTRSEQDTSPSGAVQTDCQTSPGNRALLCLLHLDRAGMGGTPAGAAASSEKGALLAMCNYHACVVDPSISESNVRLTGGGSPGVDLATLQLSGSTVSQYCKYQPVQQALGLPSLGGDIRIVRSPRSRSLAPAPLNPDTDVCIETTSGQGWCDCQGLGLPNSYQLCIDHILSDGEDCPDVSANPVLSAPSEEDCYCTASPVGCGEATAQNCAATATKCKSHAECGGGERCYATQGGARCHVNTENQSQRDQLGSSGVGDCFQNAATALTVTPKGNTDTAGICVSGNSGGPFGADLCNPAGGDGCTTCLAKVGADGVPCTDDDRLPRGEPSAIPTTSGSADSRVEDAVVALGTCSVGNQECIENANCAATETCNGVVLSNIISPTITGIPIACDGYESSDVGGYSFVSSFGFVDGVGLADGTSRNEFFCQ